MDTKSRFPSLRLFRFNGANGHNSHSSQSQSQSHSPQPLSVLQPPHPPPKDRNGNNGALFYTSSSVGAASTPDLSYHSMRSPSSDSPHFLSPVSPFAQQTSSFPSTSSLVSPAVSLRKSLTKISSLGRRSTKSTNIPHSPSLDVLPECNDEGISAPYNFQHNIHVNDTLQGMPPSWLTTLLAAGFSEEEINRLRGRQRVATHSTAAADAPVYVGSTMATFPGTYTTTRNPPSPLSQFGELQRAPSTSTTPSQNTHLHRNYHNPSTSISMFSSSVCSSSDERESLSPSSHAVQQPMLSPSYTQHFTGYTPSAQIHQTYPHSDTTRSHSPTETRSRSPTEAVTYSQHSTGMNQSELRNAITPPINTSNYHPVMYRIVNEDPTPTTPPPAYASPKSPYRFTEKGSEKAFRWDISSSTPGEGPSAPSVTSPLVTEQEPTHTSPMQSHRFMHIANQTSETEVSPILVSEEPPLLSSTRFDRPLSSNSSQVETIIGEDRHEDDDVNGRVTPSLASSPTNDSLELDAAATRTDYEGHNSMECPFEQPPNLAADPPRLSLHTDQDDDWSTILRFSFSGGVNSMDPNIDSHDFQTAAPNQSSSLPATMPLTLKSKRSSRRSSVIYGPRGSPCAKEKPFHSAETKVPSTGGLAMGVLHEQEESSPAIVHSTVQDEFTEYEEDWADNYLDMKDGDYESSEEVDTLNENRSQEVFQEEPVSRKLGCDSPITYSSPRNSTGLSPSGSLPCSLEQHGTEDDSATQIIAEYGSMDDESSHEIRSSHFSNNTVRPSSPQISQYALPSPPSSRRVSATPLYSAAPLSPSTPVFPTLSPTSAMRPSSIISRRSFDLPPPLPPPEDDLPPTPEEAASMGRIAAVSPKWPAHGMQIMQGTITHANVWAEPDSQRSLPPVATSSSNRLSSQRLLSSPSTSIPATPLSRRELPPVPLQVNTGVRHTHTPMSSISSVPTHSRSASGHLSNSIQPTVGRPPPLPLPPLGKVLPSVIMQQRRAAAAKNDLQLSKSATFNGLSTVPNLTPSSSPSTFSHSSKSAYSPDTSETGSVSDNRKTSTVHGDSYPIRVSHVSLTMDSQADEVSFPQSEEAVDASEYVIETNCDEIKHIREEDVWLAGTEDFEPSGRENNGPSDTLRNSIAESTNSSVPPTPSIAVNGFTIPTTQDVIATPEQVPPKSPQMHFISAELPLVLYPLKEYISTGVDPLDIFFELQEIAQGQYGSVYMAQVQSEGDDSALAVAVKQVPIPMKGTPKIGQLKRELSLMSKIRHKHILETLALFYEPSESMLWIQMELMERSLADILALGEEGLEIQERVIARFASDILLALTYLNEQRLSHRDVRSDNLLMNSDGILKLADLSNAVQVPQSNSIRLDIVGIHHWQAPEIRSGRYDALKIDVWSLGATVWECAEFIPPFSDVEDLSALGVRWPPISRAEEFSKDFHDFLRLCSEPATSRPPASRLLRHPFIQVACPRVDVLSLLNWCRSIEESMRIN